MISAGDMVMVVRGHACAIGECYVVGGIEGGNGICMMLSCEICGWADVLEETCAWDRVDETCCPTSWLIKIDPSTELTEEKNPEEVAA